MINSKRKVADHVLQQHKHKNKMHSQTLISNPMTNLTTHVYQRMAATPKTMPQRENQSLADQPRSSDLHKGFGRWTFIIMIIGHSTGWSIRVHQAKLDLEWRLWSVGSMDQGGENT